MNAGHPGRPVIVGVDGSDVRCKPADVVAACHQAASPFGAVAHRAVTAAATRVSGHAGISEQVRVALRERKGVVDVYVTTGRALPPHARAATRLAVRAALAPSADLAIRRPGGTT